MTTTIYSKTYIIRVTTDGETAVTKFDNAVSAGRFIRLVRTNTAGARIQWYTVPARGVAA